MHTGLLNVDDAEVTASQVSEARDWISDCNNATSTVAWEDRQVVRVVNARYPGGWSAFVEECCTYTQL